MDKSFNIITGLPRSGGSLISAILSQNPALRTETNSILPNLLGSIHHNWSQVAPDQSPETLRNILHGIVQGYHGNTEATTIFDRNLLWIPLLPLIESVLGTRLRVLICVRNPAEILSSFERSRALDPLTVSSADSKMRDHSTLAGRAFFYAGPDGILGTTHRHIQDSIIMGYLDRMLFVDYGLFCGNPRSQTKRIYDFFDLEPFEHDYEHIPQHNAGVRPRLEKANVNCVQYLGLDLFDQYNSQVFWNAWV